MKCILFGGTGQVGRAVADSLIQSGICSQLTMLVRRNIEELDKEPKIRQIIVDTDSDDFEKAVRKAAEGHDAAVCCVGIGSGTYKMKEEELIRVEAGLTGSFAGGCRAAGIEIFELLTAFGISEKSAGSVNRYMRAIGKKYTAVLDEGFPKLAVFRPGMIVGNKNTPNWMTYFTALIPDRWGLGNIHKNEIAGAFAAHLEKRAGEQKDPVVFYGNFEMKQLIR